MIPIKDNYKKIFYLYFLSFWFIDLVWFYGISTIVGYLMPNPVLHIY